MNDDDGARQHKVRQSLIPFRQQCFALHHKVALLRSVPMFVCAMPPWLLVSVVAGWLLFCTTAKERS
eukprot:scaffold16813_cov72-Skeletonema_marinoi.AAC.2